MKWELLSLGIGWCYFMYKIYRYLKRLYLDNREIAGRCIINKSSKINQLKMKGNNQLNNLTIR
jgi:hypothetical protein